MNLVSLDIDALIYIVAFLEPSDILRLSETCKTIHQLTCLRIIWANACSNHIIAAGFPFPDIPPDQISTEHLKRHTIRSYHLAKRWRSGIQGPRQTRYISGTSSTSVSDVRFVPGHDDSLLLVISKTVWSAVSIWYIGSETPHKVCEWSPRGAIFSGFCVNGDTESEATIAIALHLNDTRTVRILSLKERASGQYSLEELHCTKVDMKPSTLKGDLLALSDDFSQTAIWNWRTGSVGLLQYSAEDSSVFQSNHCIQVLFAYQSVLVIRARSIHLYPFPALEPHDADGEPPVYEPLAHHSFGWVDGESVNICPFLSRPVTAYPSATHSPLSILIRGESDDPWASDIHYIQLYTLEPNPDYEDNTTSATASPYLFPPRLSSKVACLRGSLTCRQLALGRLGTAVWIQPRDRFPGGLLADIPPRLIPASNAHESLIVAVFPGSLHVGEHENAAVVVGKKIFRNESNTSWTSFDYDEVSGRIVLASSFGRVTILEL